MKKTMRLYPGRKLIFALIAGMLMMDVTPWQTAGADEAAPTPLPDQNTRKKIPEDEAESISKMSEYVGLHSVIAGEISVCDIRVSDIIRRCLADVINQWPQVSGMTKPRDPASAVRLAEQLWQSGYDRGRAAQEKSRAQCQPLLKSVWQAPIFQVCQVRAVGGNNAVAAGHGPEPSAGSENSRPAMNGAEDNSGVFHLQ